MYTYYDKDFKDYYYKYLNYNSSENIICSEDRETLINVFYYPVIVSLFNDKIIYSINSKYFREIKENIQKENLKNKEDIINFLNNFFKIKNKKVSIQEMFRMTKNEKFNIDISKVLNIDEKNKKEYFNSFEYCHDLEYKEMKWKKVKNYKYLNGIIEDNQFVSVGFVSNIDYNGANIVIQTKEKYKNNGYGKSIVEKISRDLLKDNIIPIYWVNVNNKSSIKLAENIKFEKKVTEIVVKIEDSM
ncbi:MAG: GNAT family N-acetyltransferase [Clostridia bacterium]|nr:GNAT family N-acetyltransferase [Clostridia bacterium]